MIDHTPRCPKAGVMLGLVVIAILPYLQTWNHEFVNYDDNLYVTSNPVVKQGITSAGIAWAFKTYDGGNWHPLTWLSHMLDCTVFGVQPGPPHIENAILHAINTLLVWGFFARMTGAARRSALLAALFAVHPLHVQSVAWLAERKDLLSTLFGLLAMLGYLRFIERRTLASNLAMLACFAVSLMFKPMFVTLPALLLLLDWWPLRRIRMTAQQELAGEAVVGSSARLPSTSLPALIVEKIPLLVLAIAASVMAIVSQHAAKTTASLESLPLTARLANAAVAYAKYLEFTFFPAALSVIYPHPGEWPRQVVFWSATLLVAITIMVVALYRRSWLLCGWLWYLGMLVPVIGLVQIGSQSMADRYMYSPIIGVFVMLVWSIPTPVTLTGRRNWTVAASLVVVALAVQSWSQTSYWRDSRTLFTHALKNTTKNFMAHQNLGNALQSAGEIDDAIEQYRQAILIRPGRADLHENMGTALIQKGQYDLAMDQLKMTVQIDPESRTAYNSMGIILLAQQRYDEAEKALRHSLEIEPDNLEARGNHGLALLQLRQWNEAIDDLTIVKAGHPERVGVRTNLAMALAGAGQKDVAIGELNEIIRLRPDFKPAQAALQQLTQRPGATASPALQTTSRPGPG